jgi:predicted nucleic-acid-binding protein
VIAVDTNVLVRLLVADNIAQFRVSQKLFEVEQIYVPDSVVLETEWVLRAAYELSSTQICGALRGLFGLPNVHLRNDRQISQIIVWYESGLDFADAFHLALSAEQSSLKTFDIDFIKRAKKLGTKTVEAV